MREGWDYFWGAFDLPFLPFCGFVLGVCVSDLIGSVVWQALKAVFA